MFRYTCLWYVLLSATTSLSAAQNFMLGLNYSERIPTGALTAVYSVATANDSQGAIYLLVSGGAGQQMVTTYYLTKLNPPGDQVVYQNSLPIQPQFIAVDPSGNVYLATTNVVEKLGTDGTTVQYTTTIGPGVFIQSLAVDPSGRAYVTGWVPGDGLQTTPGALEQQPASTDTMASNAFVVRLNSSGAVDYATYLGGTSQAIGAVIAVDASGSAFVTGTALSPEFPTTAGAYLAASNMPNFNRASFLARLTPDGSALIYSTFTDTHADFVVLAGVDASDHAVLTLSPPAGPGIVVLRFNPQGTATDFERSLPASHPGGLALDANGNIYLRSPVFANYPVYNSLSVCGANGGSALTVLDSGGNTLQSTYIPGAIGYTSSIPAVGMGTGSTVYVVGFPDATYQPTRQLAGSTGQLLFLTSFSPDPSAQVMPLACIGNAGGYDSAGVAGGEIVSLFGQAMGPDTGTQPQVDVTIGFPKQLADVQVTFNGTPGPLLYVQAGQINVIAPWSLQTGQTVEVCVVYQGVATNCLARPVVDAHPGVFTVDGVYAAALNQDGTPNTASNPAAVGSTVSIFGTGLGPVDPLQADGAIVGFPLPVNVLQDRVYWLFDTWFIGTMAIYTPVSYGGPAPLEVAGVSQVNFVVQDTFQASFGGQTPYYLQAGGPMSAGVLIVPGSNPFLIHVAAQH